MSFQKFFVNFLIFGVVMASAQKKASCLTYRGTNKVSPPTDRDVWPRRSIVEDSFWIVVNASPIDVAAPFESMEGDGVHVLPNFIRGASRRHRFVHNPWSIMRIYVEKAEGAWTELRFESKAQSYQSYDVWVQVMAILGNTEDVNNPGEEGP